MATHYLVERPGKVLASDAPLSDLGESKNRCASEFGRVEVLMSNRIISNRVLRAAL